MNKFNRFFWVFFALFLPSLVVASGVTIELDTSVSMDTFTFTDETEVETSIESNPIDFSGGSDVIVDTQVDDSDEPRVVINPLDELVTLTSAFDYATLTEIDPDQDGYMSLSEAILGTGENDSIEPEKIEKALNYINFVEFVEQLASDTPNEPISLRTINSNNDANKWVILELISESDTEAEVQEESAAELNETISCVDKECVLQAQATTTEQAVYLHWIPEVKGDIYFEARILGSDGGTSINAFVNEQAYKNLPLSASDGWVKFHLKTGDVFQGRSFITSFGIGFVSETASTDVLQIRKLFASSISGDADRDGLPDRDELFFDLNPETPFRTESDEEGNEIILTDSEGNPLPDLSQDAEADFDGDGLSNIDEFEKGESNWRVADTDGDDVPDDRDDLPGDPNETVDTDNDGRGNNSDPDDDNDRIPDEVENQYSFLDPLNNEDGGEDRDQDGISNSQEYLNGTSLTYDDYGPVIRGAPSIMRVKALGDFTGVDFSGVTAFDGKDKDPKEVKQKQEWKGEEQINVFEPGTHHVTWISYDGPGDNEGNPNGNKTELEQTIIVLPLIRFDQSKVFLEEQDSEEEISDPELVSVCLNLNAVSPSYPVEVELKAKQVIEQAEVIGQLDSSDQSESGSIEETDSAQDEASEDGGTSEKAQDISFEVVFNEGDTHACSEVDLSSFSLGVKQNQNTLSGTSTTALIKVVDGDRLSFLTEDSLEVIKNDDLRKPRLTLVAEQAGVKTRAFITDQGLARVTLQAENVDLTEYVISWEGTDSELIDVNGDSVIFEFDPSILAAGSYYLKVGVLNVDEANLTDLTGAVAVADLKVNVLDVGTIDQLQVDNDNDGIPDEDELNPVEYMLSSINDGVKMIVPYGMSVSLGDDAMVVGKSSPEMTPDEFTSSYSGLIHDSEFVNRILSFNIRDLPLHGMQVPVVVKLNEVLDEFSSYYKLKNGAWVVFDQSNGDDVQSTTSVEGVCPDPGKKYSNGLRKGHDCIKLLITDGGPNDDDGVVNGIIKDPGGIGAVAAVSSVGDSNPRKKPSKMSGGSFDIFYLLALVLIVVYLIRKQRI